MKIGPGPKPQPGPQTTFLSSPADIAIYGGAAGGGKTYALTLESIRHITNPGFGAVVFRRLSTQLTGPGSIWREATGIYPIYRGAPREGAQMDWVFPSGAQIEFRHLQYTKDVASHMSKQYALIVYDQLEQFDGDQFWDMSSRNRSVCGVPPYQRGACNPDPDCFLYDNGNGLIAWWIGEDGYPISERSGKIRWFARQQDDRLVWADSKEQLKRENPDLFRIDPNIATSITFVAARLEDNQILMDKDPTYRSKLLNLPMVKRERLLSGNWKIRPTAGTMFRGNWYGRVDRAPSDLSVVCRGWDLAATEKRDGNDPAYTVGVLYGVDYVGEYFVMDVIRERVGPGGVEGLLKRTAKRDRDNRYDTVQAIWRDPGGAGKHMADHLGRLLSAYSTHFETAKESKVAYAEPVSSQCEQGHVSIVRGDWNQSYISEHEAFPDGKFKDQVDATSLAHIVCSSAVPVAVSGGLEREPQWDV